MCGIVGLFLKDRRLDSSLGSLLSDMLVTMSDRGPDSAGIAVYGKPTLGQIKVTVQSPQAEQDLRSLAGDLEKAGLKSSVEITKFCVFTPFLKVIKVITEISTIIPILAIVIIIVVISS